MNQLDKDELIAVLEKQSALGSRFRDTMAFTDAARDAEYRLRLLQSHFKSPVTSAIEKRELLDLVTWLERNYHQRLARVLKATL